MRQAGTTPTQFTVPVLLLCALVAATVPMTLAAQVTDQAAAIEGRVIDRLSGNGLPGVEVKLIAPDGTLMDIVETGEDGRYQLDLGVLDTEEFPVLPQFLIDVKDTNGRHVRRPVGTETVLEGGILKYRVIQLP